MRDHLEVLDTATEATGIGGVGGNKGGVGIAIQLHRTTMCFVTAHLAAHQEMTKRRNADCMNIFKGMRSLGAVKIPGTKQLDPSICFDHIFFFGDLNYRIAMPLEAVLDIVDDDRQSMPPWQKLHAQDQLREELANGRVLTGFSETPPLFAPTFKRIKNKGKLGDKDLGRDSGVEADEDKEDKKPSAAPAAEVKKCANPLKRVSLLAGGLLSSPSALKADIGAPKESEASGGRKPGEPPSLAGGLSMGGSMGGSMGPRLDSMEEEKSPDEEEAEEGGGSTNSSATSLLDRGRNLFRASDLKSQQGHSQDLLDQIAKAGGKPKVARLLEDSEEGEADLKHRPSYSGSQREGDLSEQELLEQRCKSMGYNPSRIPSWCDRVLYRSYPMCYCEQTSYRAVTAVDTSDHTPVCATFGVRVLLPSNTEDSVGDRHQWELSIGAVSMRIPLSGLDEEDALAASVAVPELLLEFCGDFIRTGYTTPPLKAELTKEGGGGHGGEQRRGAAPPRVSFTALLTLPICVSFTALLTLPSLISSTALLIPPLSRLVHRRLALGQL